jgi:hypothetical protein
LLTGNRKKLQGVSSGNCTPGWVFQILPLCKTWPHQ